MPQPQKTKNHSGAAQCLCSEFANKEKSRYERKGYGLIVATMIAMSFFLGVPYFGRQLWPYLLDW